jgi:hypothetical protein
MPLSKSILAAAVLSAFCSAAAAAPDSPLTFSFAGFGTLGLVHSSESRADFTSSNFQARGAGYSRRWSPNVDSLIAGQITASVGPRWTAVLQVVAQESYDNTYLPQIEWANVQYAITPDFTVRLGRTATGSFLISDTRKIGYAHPWVRPPTELYSMVSVTSNDGADLSYRARTGPATNTLHASIGSIDYRYPIGGGVDTEHVNSHEQMAIYDTLERGPITLHASYGQAHVTIPRLGTLFAAYREFGAQGTAIADRYDVDDSIVGFAGLGANYDPGSWFLTGEWARVHSHSAIGEKTAWYLSSGFRLGNWTPYLTFADLRANTPTSAAGITPNTLPPALAATAANLNAGLNQALDSINAQKTLSAGARWDFVNFADLKFQFDHTQLGAGSEGVLINLQPGFRRGASVNLASLTIDFVW